MNILHKLILKSLSNPDVLTQVAKLLVPAVVTLDPKKKYIITLPTQLSDKDASEFVETLSGTDVVLMHGIRDVKVIELTIE